MAMRASDHHLSETDIRPADAEVWTVRADAGDERPWLSDAPVCPALANYQIRHAGVARMAAPFEIVRIRLGGSYFLACFGGEGRVLVDGGWVACRSGQAALLPPGTLHAFHALKGRRWDICWVRYQERPGQTPLAAAQTPVIAAYDAEPLRLALLGLHRECTTAAIPAAVEAWVALAHLYVLRFARPASLDPRIWRLWEKVAARLDHAWTVTEMAAEAHLSEKQLERLCLKQLGRNPRRHLIWLRMRQAAEMLTAGDAKVETVAARIGYKNPFVFSTTFTRVMGWSPSAYTGRRAPQTDPRAARRDGPSG
jgi:AraC-like DNA-binding protein